ncbi:ABC transporter permease [Paenibacillus humicola]|uniref:ABC transporter permease n=1 Tax=Paenibacillus humicola TaxID=3110540 RepID=UPI003B8378B6
MVVPGAHSLSGGGTAAAGSRPRPERLGRIIKNRWLYVLLLPGALYFALFKYWPMWGIVISFQNYQPFLGISGSEWVGFEHFRRFFTDDQFWTLLRNTSVLAVLNIVFFFPLPIVIALMLNELRSGLYKRFLQTLIYVPHFVSWVVVVGVVYIFFSTEEGIFNQLLAQLGFHKINFLLSKAWFPVMITAEVIWKETGWGTIIFLAALAAVDVSLYESARLDGAGRWRQMWHVTLPGIRGTIIILFILRLGQFLDTSFEQIFLMVNSANREVGDVYDTYVYMTGIRQGQFSYSAAVGLFKSVVGLVLVLLANKLAKKSGEEGVF